MSMNGSGVYAVQVDVEFFCAECVDCVEEGLTPCATVEWTDALWTGDNGSLDGARSECPKCEHYKYVSEA